MDRKSERLRERLSKSRSESAVDFEISFAALLATASITYPVPGNEFISQTSAFAVLVVTLSRRMAIQSAFIDDEDGRGRRERFMKFSIPFLELFSVVAILTLLHVLYLEVLSDVVGIALYWLSVSIGVMALAVVQEVIFRDELLWWYQKYAARFDLEADEGATIWAYIAFKAWDWSRAPIADHGRGRYNFGPSYEGDYSLRDSVKYFIKGTWLYLLVNGMILFFGFQFFGVGGLFIVFGIGAIRDQTRFWYSAYGNSTFDQMSGPWWRTYLMLLIYIGIFELLL